MKTSLFDMTFTLPPMVEITEVEKQMPTATAGEAPFCPHTFTGCAPWLSCPWGQENLMKSFIFDMRQIGSQPLQDSPLRWAISIDGLQPAIKQVEGIPNCLGIQ